MSRKFISNDMFVRLCRSREYLGDCANSPVRLDFAARLSYLSKYHYLRMFATAFGETPLEFVTRVRMERAQSLLVNSEWSVTEICLEVGYESLATFSNRFRRFAGYAPSEIRRQARRSCAMPNLATIYNVPACFFALASENRNFE
jgi:AraC-like DNA-binding protein